MLFFLNRQNGTEIDADDPAQSRARKKTRRFDERFRHERHLDEKVKRERYQNNDERGDQALQETVFLRGVAGEKAEYKKRGDAQNKGDGVKSGQLAVGFPKKD